MKPIDARETARLLKEIERGVYRDTYLVYCRKSTDDTDHQKNSIAYQRAEGTKLSSRATLPVAPISLEGFCRDGIISERHSGFKEDAELEIGNDFSVRFRVSRPKFHKLVQFLNKGYFKGVICLCWDRMSRNRGDDMIIRKLMKRGVEVHFVLAQYDDSSAGELHMDIDGMFAEHHSRVTREKVRLTIRQKRSQGFCTNRAPIGYLNKGIEAKPIDPERGPIIRRLFELAATGLWSLSDLTAHAITLGLTMRPMRRRRTVEEMLADGEEDEIAELPKVTRLPTVTNIHRILTNPFYMGKTLDADRRWIPSASHEALVSEELFTRVQDMLAVRRTSAHYTDVRALPFRRFVRCTCGRRYSPYTQKGKIYLGARCAPGCTNRRKNVSLAYVVELVSERLERLIFTKEELAHIEASMRTGINLNEIRRIEAIEEGTLKKKRLRESLKYVKGQCLDLLRAGVYTPESLVAEEARLSAELRALNAEEEISDEAAHLLARDIMDISELLKNPKNLYDLAETADQDTVTRIVFSELVLAENTAQFQCTRGFKAFETRILSVGDPTDWLSELAPYRDDIKQALRDLKAALGQIGNQQGGSATS